MNNEDWKELARTRAFSDARLLLIYHYYEREKPLDFLAEWIGISERELRERMRFYNLPLREEDKANGGLRNSSM